MSPGLSAGRLGFLLLAALAFLACDSKAVVDGKLTAIDGRTDTGCAVELHDEVGDPGTGLRCHEPGDPGHDPHAGVVRIGHEFECLTVANGAAIGVTASCEGHEPYRSPPIRWSVWRFRTDPHHLGEIVLKRAAGLGGAHPVE